MKKKNVFFTSFRMTMKSGHFALLRVTFLLIIISGNVFSQTTHPTQVKLKYKGYNLFLDKHLDLQQKKFSVGYHWNFGAKMSQALGAVNQIHWFEPDDTVEASIADFASNSNIIINTPVFSNHWNCNFQLSRAKSSVFEPTYLVDISNPFQTFIPRTYDTTRYCMGFANIKGIISTSNTDLNYNRLQLLKSNLNNEVVLSDNWPANDYVTSINLDSNNNIEQLPYENLYGKSSFNPSNSSTDNILAPDCKGVNNYLNINLRRIDTTTNLNNDIVLSIKLEYVTFQYDTVRKNTNIIDTIIPRKRGYIRFDSIPQSEPDSIFNLPYGRGIVRKMNIKNLDTITTINITRAMLPKANASQKDITISSWFICDAQTSSDFLHNYGLAGFPKGDKTNTIDSLKIIVQYYDTCDIGIDWISINNRATRELSFGWLDTMLAKKLQKSINLYSSTTFSNKYIQPFRWYLNDEPVYMSEWYSRHYLTKLFGQIFTQEGGTPNLQFDYFCNPKENWWGQGKFKASQHTPYIKFQNGNYSPENAYWPNLGCYTWNVPTDSARYFQHLLSSYYETYTDRHWFTGNWHFNYFKNNNIKRSNIVGAGNLVGIDQFEYSGLLDPNYNQFLFNGKIWWGQIWNDATYNFPYKDTVWLKKYNRISSYFLVRNMTGEEFRYLMKRTIYYGAKGFVLDGEMSKIWNSVSSVDGPLNLHHGQHIVNKLSLNSVPVWEFLERNDIGGDFLDVGDPNDLLAQYLDLNYIAPNMGIDPKRYYVGRKSVRREFRKVNEFILNQDSLLMKLQLVAALSKGFLENYLQKWNSPTNSIITDTILKNFINIYDIRTRPLNRVRPYYEQEGIDSTTLGKIDSGFYNITFLKQTAKLNIDSIFYLGVLNKRTGPHLWLDSAQAGGKLDSIAFITTAELDSLCDSPDSLKWRKYYWKRLGTREITLFFNDTTFDRTTKILKVSELENYDTTGYYTWNYWRKENYHNRLNTTLYPNQPLKVKLLPGDGRMLKIESKDLTPADTVCDCDKVLPKTVLDIKRAATDSCYTFNLEIYPCPNKVMDNLRVYLFKMPPCFKKQFIVQIYKNDVYDTTGLVDLSSNTVLNFPTGITSADGKVNLKIVMCPINGSPFCVPSELDSMFAVIQIAGANCPNPLDVISSVKLDNFNQDFNKFFQTEFNNFSIVPNPATTYIDLSFESPLTINSKVYILDEQGRILKERMVTADSNEKLTIDVNQLSNGTYFIAVYDKDILIKGKPFLIMK